MGPGKESWFSLLLLLLFWRRGSRPLSLTRTHSHTRKKGNGGISRMGAAAAGGGGGRACLPFMTDLSRGEGEYHIFRTLPPSSPCPVRGKGGEKGTSPPPARRRPSTLNSLNARMEMAPRPLPRPLSLPSPVRRKGREEGLSSLLLYRPT